MAAPPAQAPFRAQDPQEVAQLVRDLGNAKGKGSKTLAKKNTYPLAHSQDGISVDSWRLQDYAYKQRGLPTYARGLFTTRNRRGEHEIAARGYDKFFNTDEVPETKWDTIRRKTKGPYELTLKENGCIIFISGLEDGTLLVCSKHATGDRGPSVVTHSNAGERWVDQQLATIGKSRQDLAQDLRRRNATAVAELCDDAFEEHILAYGPERAGLYLHGVNLNLPEFMTYPSDQVQQFADDWGFRKVGLQIFDDIEKVKTFLDGVAETGAHEGRDVEGFVVRCKMSPNPDGKLPYSDWFFKYKFEEPYLMYRQWRECTKALIAGNPPKYKKHINITEQYLNFARRQLQGNPEKRQEYVHNHGIIELRDAFLAYKHMKGSDAANLELQDPTTSEVFKDVVLVPIATIGCGKTTVGMALSNLFGWDVVQNDDITGKSRPRQMVAQLAAALWQVPAVISDRNNSMRREREQIIEDMTKELSCVKLIALNFAHGDIDEVRRITRERVMKRGDNHQTIQAATDDAKVISIMEDFIHRYQPCDPEKSPDNRFDYIIDLDPTAGSRANVEVVVKELHEKYPQLVSKMPTSEEMDEAVKAAIEYVPKFRQTIGDKSSKRQQKQQTKQTQQQQEAKEPKKKPLEYMGVSVPTQALTAAIENAFKEKDPQTQRFYRQLQQTRRVQPLFHVTLMHRASAKQHPELWARYTALEAEMLSTDDRVGECNVQLERIVFDDRIMAIVVRLYEEPLGQEEQQQNQEVASKWQCVNRIAHITVGTRDGTVKPVESNTLLTRWLEEGARPAENHIQEVVIDTKPVLKGIVRPVLAR